MGWPAQWFIQELCPTYLSTSTHLYRHVCAYVLDYITFEVRVQAQELSSAQKTAIVFIKRGDEKNMGIV